MREGFGKGQGKGKGKEGRRGEGGERGKGGEGLEWGGCWGICILVFFCFQLLFHSIMVKINFHQYLETKKSLSEKIRLLYKG